MSKLPYDWSPDAREELNKTIIYVLDNFGVNSAQKFKNEVDHLIKKIRLNGGLCPVYKHGSLLIRRCVINKQTSLNYTITDQGLYILSIYGNRTDHQSF